MSGWTRSGTYQGQDCLPHMAIHEICSLQMDPKFRQQLVKVERVLDHELGPAPYILSFYYRAESVHSFSDYWFILELPGAGWIKLDLTYADPNDRVGLWVNSSERSDASLGFATYEKQRWYKTTLLLDPAADTVSAEVRDLNDNLIGRSRTLAISPEATVIGRIAFEGIFSGTDILNEPPRQMNFDRLRIVTSNVPNAPVNLSARGGPGAGEVTLQWEPPGVNGGSPVESYNIYAGDHPDDLVRIVTAHPWTTFKEAGLGIARWRHYKVTASNIVGEGDFSNATSARTFALPSAPVNVTATPGPGTGEVTLAFDPPADEGGSAVTGYSIYKGPTATSLSRVADTGVVRWWRDHDLPGNTTYHYEIRARSAAGEGAPSAAQATTLPREATWDECDLFRHLIDRPDLVLLNDGEAFCTVTAPEALQAPLPYVDADGGFNRTKMDQLLARLETFATAQNLTGVDLGPLDELVAPQFQPFDDRTRLPRRGLCLDCFPPDLTCFTCRPIPEEDRQAQAKEYISNWSRYVEESARGIANETIELVDTVRHGAIGEVASGLLDTVHDPHSFQHVNERLDSVVAAPTEPVQALARCAAQTVPEVADLPNTSVLQATPIDDVTTCVSEIIRPILWDLLTRVRATIGPLEPLVQVLDDKLRPTVATVVQALPPSLRVTEQALLEDPIGYIASSTLRLGDLDLAMLASETVSNTEAQVQVATAKLAAADSRHPQLVYDRLRPLTKDGVLQPLGDEGARAIGDHNWQASNLTGERVNPVAVVDSLVFNLYTNRSGTERITPVVWGRRTCVQLDDSLLTRDAFGCDLYANFTVTTESIAGLPGGGSLVNFALKLEKANPLVSVRLEALGYIQVLNEPYILVLGYDVTDALGIPLAWEGSFTGYDTRLDPGNRRIAFQAGHLDARPAIPMKLTAAAFRVNVSQAGKPVIPGNETVVHATSSAMPPSVALSRSKTTTPLLTAYETRVTTPVEVALDVNMTDLVMGHEHTERFDATALSAGESRMAYRRSLEQSNVTWSASGPAGRVNLTYTEGNVSDPSRPIRAFQVIGENVPQGFWLKSDRTVDEHRYDAMAAPGALAVVVVEGHHSCPSRNELEGNSLVVSAGGDRRCLTAKAGTLVSLGAANATEASVLAEAWGEGGASLDPAVVAVDSGVQLFARMDDMPAAWRAKLVREPDGRRSLFWEASAPVEHLEFSVAVPQPSGNTERAKVNASQASPFLNATVDPVLQVARVSGSASYGSAQGWITNSGQAPHSEPPLGGYYLRAKRPATVEEGAELVEAAFRAGSTNSLLAEARNGGDFHLAGNLDSPQAVSAFFQNVEQGYAVSVELEGVNGTIDEELTASRAAGAFTYRHASGNTSSKLVVKGDTPHGAVHIEAARVPRGLTIQGSWLSLADAQGVAAPQTFRLWSEDGSAVGDARVTFAAAGAYLERQNETDTLLMFQGGSGAPEGLHFRGTEFAEVTATNDAGAIHLDTVPEKSLNAYFQQSGGAYDATASPAKDVHLALHGGAFSFTSGEQLLSMGYKASRVGGHYFRIAGADLGQHVSLRWPLERAANHTVALVHDRDPELGSLSVDVHESSDHAASSGWSISGLGIPPYLDIGLDSATGHATLLARDSTGSAALVSDLRLAYSNRAPSLQIPQHDGDYVRLLYQGGPRSEAVGALRLTNVSKLAAHLLPAGLGTLNGRASVEMQRGTESPTILEAQALPLGLRLGMEAANVKGDISGDLRFDTQTGAFVAGMGSNSPLSGASLAFTGAAGGRQIHLKATGVSTATNLSWTVGGELNLTATQVSAITAWTWPEGEARPQEAGKNYVSARLGPSDTSLGLNLSSVRHVDLRYSEGVLRFSGASNARAFELDVAHADRTLSISTRRTPASLESVWKLTPLIHEFRLKPGTAIQDLVLDLRAPDVGRIHIQAPSIPIGEFNLTHDRGAGSVQVNVPGSASNFSLVSDDGRTEGAALLARPGFAAVRDVEGQAVRLNATSVTRFSFPAGDPAAAVQFAMNRSAGAPAIPFDVNIEDRGRVSHASLSAVGAGETVLGWGESALVENLRFHARRTAGGSIQMGYQNATGERGMVAMTGAPADWTLQFDPDGRLTHSGGNATTLSASGVWRGGAFLVDALGVPAALVASVSPSMLSGEVATAPGTSVARINLAVTPRSSTGAEGSVAITPAPPGRSQLLIDSGESGGTMSLNMSDLTRIAWRIPGQTGAGELEFALSRTNPAPGQGLIEVAHPEHQTRLEFPQGLPAAAYLNVTPKPEEWSALLQAGGNPIRIMYQDSAGRGLNLSSDKPSPSATVSFSPKNPTSPIRINTTGVLGNLSINSMWGGSVVRADVEDLASGAVLDTRLASLTLSGSVTSTLAAGRVKLLYVPDATNTVNRLAFQGNHLAVEAGGRAPYLAVQTQNLLNWSWSLPDTGEDAQASLTLGASEHMEGATRIELASRGADALSAALHNVGKSGSLRAQGASPAGGPAQAPLRFVYAALDGPTAAVKASFLTAATGQAGTAAWSVIPSGTVSNLVASGLGLLQLDNAGIPPAKASVETIDRGRFLNLSVQSPPGSLNVSLNEAGCASAGSPFFEVDTNGANAGPTTIRYGPAPRVPPVQPGSYVDLRCKEDLSLGLSLPVLNTLEAVVLDCGMKFPIPGTKGRLTDVYLVTPQARVTGAVDTGDDAGILTVTISCADTDDGKEIAVGYAMKGTHNTAGPIQDRANRIRLNYTSTPLTPDQCMDVQGRCLKTLQIAGSDLPPSADLRTLGSEGRFLLDLRGASGGALDISMLLEKGPFEPSKDLQVRIDARMPLQGLSFLKTDLENAQVKGPGNRIVYTDMHGENTLYVQAQGGINDVRYNMKTSVAEERREVELHYNGTSPHGLDVFLKDENCSKKRIAVSNLPGSYGLRYVGAGAWVQHVDVFRQVAPVSRMSFAERMGADCSNGSEGMEWYVQAEEMPGPWKGGIMLVPRGFVKAHPYAPDQGIGHARFGMRSINEPDRYIEIHIKDVNIALEWNFQVFGEYGDDPYLYCHSGRNAVVTVRAQWDQAGIGLNPSPSPGDIRCSHSMVRLKLDWWAAAKALLTPRWLGASPLLERAGTLTFNLEVGPPRFEFYVMGRWWSFPFASWEAARI